MIFLPGTPRLAICAWDGIGGDPVASAVTLYLPMPDNGMPTVEWIEKGYKTDLVTGSESNRLLGYIPELTMRWSAFDDRPTEGFTIGQANGNRPAITDLLYLISRYVPGIPNNGYLAVSPGPAAGGFIVMSTKRSPIGVVGQQGFAKGVQVTFRGGWVQTPPPAGLGMSLGAFPPTVGPVA